LIFPKGFSKKKSLSCLKEANVYIKEILKNGETMENPGQKDESYRDGGSKNQRVSHDEQS
jgi:hypothetical protein